MKFLLRRFLRRIHTEFPTNDLKASYQAHYPFILDGYSDLLEDSDWNLGN